MGKVVTSFLRFCGTKIPVIPGLEHIHPTVHAWWLLLLVVSIGHIGLAGKRLLFSADPESSTLAKQALLSFIYAFVCGFRGWFPRQDTEKLCLFGSLPRISCPALGRTLATIAEICFAAQWYLFFSEMYKLHFEIAEQLGDGQSPAATSFFYAVLSHITGFFVRIMVPAICTAQCCCWCGITTRLEIWNGIEESIWGTIFGGLALCCFELVCILGPQTASLLTDASVDVPGLTALSAHIDFLTSYFLVPLGIVFPCYVYYMFTVDVPMYVNNWLTAKNVLPEQQPAEGNDKVAKTPGAPKASTLQKRSATPPPKMKSSEGTTKSPSTTSSVGSLLSKFLYDNRNFRERAYKGFVEALTCKGATDEKIWEPHMGWMFLYFTFAVWGSLMLAAPGLQARPEHLVSLLYTPKPEVAASAPDDVWSQYVAAVSSATDGVWSYVAALKESVR